jgi:hypothetical protein
MGVHRLAREGPVLPDDVIELPSFQREQFGLVFYGVLRRV